MKFNTPLTKFMGSILAILFLITSFGRPIEATVADRTVSIKEVIGTVWVKKSGGNLPLRVYTGMDLQQGDQITTDAYSSVQLVVDDTKDEMTLTKNADLVLTDLRTEGGHKVTRFTVRSGSVFSSVTPLKKERDLFEVNTPSQKMSVRGTHFIIAVDPRTSESTLAVLSGVVHTSTTNRGAEGHAVFPGQQISMNPTDEQNNPEQHTGVWDPATWIHQTSPEIIEQLIKSKVEIDKENEQLMKKIKADLGNGDTQTGSSLSVDQPADLERVKKNLENLIGHIIKQAIDSKTVNESSIRQMITNLNMTAGSKLDLDKLEDLQFTEAELVKRNELNRLAEAKKQKMEELKKQEEEVKRQNEELLKKLQAQREQLEVQKKNAAEEAKRKAEELYTSSLEAAALAVFEANKRMKENERHQQDTALAEEKKKAEPTPPPAPSRPTPNPIVEINRKLEAAKANIPDNLDLYTEESRINLTTAVELPETTLEEKIEKTEAILMAIENLQPISDPYNPDNPDNPDNSDFPVVPAHHTIQL